MFNAKDFTVPKAKPLPIMLLLDVSGSMSGIKINTLNDAVRTMLEAFSNEEQMETDIIISIITFGNELTRLFPFTPASKISFSNLEARGGTPLGKTLEMAKAIIEDKDETPGKAYRPTIILVSDGRPGDSWQTPLAKFISEGRSSKCDRMAMAIGADADLDVLGKFVEGTANPLFEAHRATEIHNFFKKVTMSVTTRTKSINPNQIPAIDFKEISSQPTSTHQSNNKEKSSVELDGPTIQVAQVNTVDNDDDYF